jgi:abequosyltransferase
MLDNLASGCDVYLCGLTLCTFDMTPVAEHPVARIKREAIFELGRARERRRYFRRALTTTAFFSFAGSLTFKKSRWDAIGLDENFVGSLWAHVARFFQMIPGGLRLHYLPEPYLFKRTENDSFMERGAVHRYAIAIDGYHRLARAHFREGSPEARHIHRVITNEFPPWGLLEVKFNAERERPEDVPEVNRLAAEAYRGGLLRDPVYRALYDHTPRPAYRGAQATVRTARSVAGSVRTLRRGEPQAAAR